MEERVKKISEGTIIYQQGEEGETLGYLTSGKVGLYLNYREPEQFALEEIGVGEVFGEMGLLTDVNRSVTAVALTDVEFYEISEKSLPNFVSRHPDLAAEMLKAFSKRLMSVTVELVNAHQTIREFIEELGDRPVLKESLRDKIKRYASFFLEVPADIPPEVYMDYYSRIDRL